MTFHSRWSLVVSAVAGLSALGLVTAIGQTNELAPVPVRFPEAANAFLYSNPSQGHVWSLFAGCAFAAALWTIATARRQIRKRPDDRPWIPIKLSIFCGLGIALSVVAMLVLWREASTYAALTDTGFVARTSTNDIVRENWSSLHHVELVCEKTQSGGRPIRPDLYLHFLNGRSVEYLTTMLPTGTTKEDRNPRIERLRTDALVRVETLRNQNGAPLIWDSDVQQKQFEANDRGILRCVEMLLAHFPRDYQQVLLATLTDAERIRRETLASYRQSCRCFDR